MILILGGTTEGRRAVRVCEEAGKPYYYSTKSDSQGISLVHGIRLTGGMDAEEMLLFCRQQGIRLIIDADHPFAEQLHQHIATASGTLAIPVIRYERTFPERTEDLLYFNTYDEIISYLKKKRIENSLVLFGANTIIRLKPYWQDHPCIFRILDRNESRETAHQAGLPAEAIIYYHPEEKERAVFERINPSVIITKESGESRDFIQKVQAAKALRIPVLVIGKPELPPSFSTVYGEYGLRKETEKLLPGFFPLRTGYTTGSCATAATKAALLRLLSGDTPAEVTITLPNKEQINIPVATVFSKDGTGYATVIKDSGDDPDVTNGLAICASVRLLATEKGIRIKGRAGIGTVTLPGLGLEPGAPAINPVSQQMIRQEVTAILDCYRDFLPGQREHTGVEVVIFVPEGERLLRKHLILN